MKYNILYTAALILLIIIVALLHISYYGNAQAMYEISESLFKDYRPTDNPGLLESLTVQMKVIRGTQTNLSFALWIGYMAVVMNCILLLVYGKWSNKSLKVSA